jgi:general secretion pathway protein L
MLHASRRLLLRVAGGELEVSVIEAGKREVLDVYSLDQDARLQQQQLRDQLLERELHEVPRDLLLDADDVLVREVQLPMAAESNLRQALGFEMDRQTPFAAGNVFYDYRVLHRDRDSEQVRAEMAVCPKATVEALLETLRPRGLQPSGVDVEVNGEPAGFNILPIELRYRTINRNARINLGLGAVAILMLALVMMQSLWLRQHQVEQLEQSIEEVRAEARTVQGIRKQIEDASEAAGFMTGRRLESPPAVAVLAEATRILPDDTYLDRLRVWDGNVQLQGKSANAQQLIETVNASQLFENASFKGPTRLDTSSGLEIFDLNSELVVAGGK